MPMLALTPDEKVAGKLLLYWGIRPHLITLPATVEDGFTRGAALVRDTGIGKTGDLIIIAAGIPLGKAGSTNMLKVEKI
jgi:pyruvate kinase